MRKGLKFFGWIGVALAITLGGCKKDESVPAALTLTSLMSGTTNLNRQDTAAGVSVSLNIIAVFSTNLDYTTVNKTSVMLTHDTSHVTLSYIIAGNSLAIVPSSTAGLLQGAHLTLTLTDQLKSTQGLTFPGAKFVFTTLGVGIDTPPPAAIPAQVLYLQFNGGVTDLTGNATTTFVQASYVADRFGVANSAAYLNGSAGGNGDIIELSGSKLLNPSMTLSVWLNIGKVNYEHGNRAILGLAADKGYYFEIGGDSVLEGPDLQVEGPNLIRFATDHRVSSDSLGYRTSVSSYTAADAVNDTITLASSNPVNKLVQDGWHQFVMTYDSTTHLKTFYIDGNHIEQWLLSGPNNNLDYKEMALNPNVLPDLVLDTKLAIGYYCSKSNTASPLFDYSTAFNTFVGAVDDLRIFDIALTSGQVSTLYTLERPPL